MKRLREHQRQPEGQHGAHRAGPCCPRNHQRQAERHSRGQYAPKRPPFRRQGHAHKPCHQQGQPAEKGSIQFTRLCRTGREHARVPLRHPRIVKPVLLRDARAQKLEAEAHRLRPPHPKLQRGFPGGEQIGPSHPQAARRHATAHKAHTRGNKHAHCHSARAKGRYAAHIHFQGKALRKAKHGPIYAAQRQQGARKRLLHCGRPSLPGSPLCAGRLCRAHFPSVRHGAPPSHAPCTATGREAAAAGHASGRPAAQAAPKAGEKGPSGRPPPAGRLRRLFHRQR